MKNEFQLNLPTSEGQREQEICQEFIKSRDAIFTAKSPAERFNAVLRNDKAREILIFQFNYTLEKIAELVDNNSKNGISSETQD